MTKKKGIASYYIIETMVERLIEQGMGIELVAKYTNLSKEEIEKIKGEI